MARSNDAFDVISLFFAQNTNYDTILNDNYDDEDKTEEFQED